MHRKRLLRAPLVALFALLSVLIVPAAAQGHHISLVASCDAASNVNWTVNFHSFSGPSRPTVKGTVKLDGAVVQEVPPATIDFSTNPGTLKGSKAAAGGQAHVVRAEFEWIQPSGEKTQWKEATTNECPKPAISLVKTGAATASAGATFTYSFAATNAGNVPLTEVALTDDRCQSTLVRVADGDATFDPGDVWNYTCTVVAPAGPARVDNNAEVCGTYGPAGIPPTTVCAEDTHTFTVPPPTAPPVVPPAGGTPGGGTLPETIASGRARLRGPSGCVKRAFRARVRGRSIASVAFYVDGKRAKTITGRRASYSIKVNPSRFGFGRHRVVARVKFVARSGTKARKLPLTFRRCAQGAVAPRFTG